MEGPEIKKENVETLLNTKFIKVFDLQYAPGRHYYDATRHNLEQLTATKSEEAFRTMLPDAVTCFCVLLTPDGPRLLLFYEYRYPTGRFLLSPPAGMIDQDDAEKDEPLLEAAKREIFEETGLVIGPADRLTVINPLAFSTPGMTDESNALVGAVVSVPDLSVLNQNGAEGTECFDGFELVTRKEAETLLKNGRDRYGHAFSMFTWGALMYFVSGMWE